MVRVFYFCSKFYDCPLSGLNFIFATDSHRLKRIFIEMNKIKFLISVNLQKSVKSVANFHFDISNGHTFPILKDCKK